MNSLLSNNSTEDLDGGGIANNGALTIIASTLTGNVAPSGGGLFNYSGTAIVSDSTFSTNFAGTGGAIYTYAQQLVLTGCTMSGNSAYGAGGAIVSIGLTMTTKNSIFAGNSAPMGRDVTGSIGSLGHNLIGDGTGGSGYVASDLVGTAENPIDPLLGPLQDNGGPTPTMALFPGSPAIDAGDSNGVPQWDQRGENYRRIVNGAVDIGAFELQSIESPINGPYQMFALPPCDHCSSREEPLGFTFDFFGRAFNTVWVNNNGTVSFDGPFGEFVPGPLAETGRALLAPYWADVLTVVPGLHQVTYGMGTLDGDPTFGATWENVGPFHPSGLRNTFQVVLVDHTARLGYFEIQFNYYTLRWDHADSSNQAPRVGYSNGAGVAEEVSGSGNFNVLLDDGSNSLQVLRRYTVIVYPSSLGGSPLVGDVFRFAETTSPVQATAQGIPSAVSDDATRNYASLDGIYDMTSQPVFEHASPLAFVPRQLGADLLIPDPLVIDDRFVML